MKSFLSEYKSNIALVIGNGINRYGSSKLEDSWHDLLLKLAAPYFTEGLPSIPNGVSLTEFYDVLDLKSQRLVSEKTLQNKFCDFMETWQPEPHHRRIVKWAKDSDVPILTTNFENILSKTEDFSLKRTKTSGFTDYYPWENYYSYKEISDPSKEFGIWHINGTQHYHRSIRLGLTHYMGSVERARSWIHKGNESSLFSGKDVVDWRGFSTWLHVVFNTPLLIFGLGLEENEVFFRWLLIERARYFKKFPARVKDAWYVHVGDFKSEGKRFFLEGIGIKLIQVGSYDEIYGVDTWM
jgi:hypothetical protein